MRTAGPRPAFIEGCYLARGDNYYWRGFESTDLGKALAMLPLPWVKSIRFGLDLEDGQRQPLLLELRKARSGWSLSASHQHEFLVDLDERDEELAIYFTDYFMPTTFEHEGRRQYPLSTQPVGRHQFALLGPITRPDKIFFDVTESTEKRIIRLAVENHPRYGRNRWYLAAYQTHWNFGDIDTLRAQIHFVPMYEQTRIPSAA